ncbi:glutamyl-tRNA reductase [Halobium palmae]|uniref:Glutamyl-tRNA reductase n=1 Tax=Halobium palmae TaxID=1776492 RepID=A0ABD5RV44_9EURY
MRPEPPAELSLTAEIDGIDPEMVRQLIRRRADDLKRRELQKAFDQLEARGTLTPEERRIIAQMATNIVDQILAAPESAVEDISEYEPGTVRTVIELFGPD